MFPEILIFAAILWLLLGRGRRGACGGGRLDRERGLEPRARHARPRRDRVAGRRQQPATLPPESVEDRLRREYVAGRISVEEYESRLDELYRR
ncbi:MAG: hypothetical protein ACRELV_00275 [Longimicrobiales bacterium]